MIAVQSEAIIERMKFQKNFTKDKDLAEYFDVSTQVLSSWKKKNSLPFDKAVKFAIDNEISVDWLLFGEDDKKSPLSVPEQMLLTAFNALDDKQKLEAIGLLSGLGKSAVSGKNIFNDNTNIGVMTDSIAQPITQHFGKRKR